MQINRKPTGPFVRVIMWYGDKAIYDMSGTDDDHVLDPSDRRKFTYDMCRQILRDIEAEAGASRPRLGVAN
jgi:hypothetical protein